MIGILFDGLVGLLPPKIAAVGLFLLVIAFAGIAIWALS
jgi:hypothetical protein